MRLDPKELESTSYYSMYLLMAEQIIQRTKIKRGNCLEISAGNGLFGIAVAQITDLHLYILESSMEMINRACGNVQRSNLMNRVHLLKGCLRQIPLEDQTMDLVISRSSVFFWQSQVKAFQEIYRVLAPGGMACIGGGFWAKDTKRKVDQLLEKYNPELKEGFIWRQSMRNIEQKLSRARITSFEINCSDEGLWIVIRKPIRRQEVS